MPDPAARLYRNAVREARIVLSVWALALAWTVGWCYLRGYEHAPDSWAVQAGLALPRTAENFRQIAGLPDWVLFGIVLPWVACSLFTALFGVAIMRDDDLGREAGEGADHGA
jgi:hypothetical protein